MKTTKVDYQRLVVCVWDKNQDKFIPEHPIAEWREPKGAGDLIWHCSEEDSGPDVGLHLGLGEGKSIWFGEISRREWYHLSDEAKSALGARYGWWIILHDGKERITIGKCGDIHEARKAIENLAASISKPT